MAVNWDSLHADQYQAAGGDAKFYRQGNYVEGAGQGYLIDKKTVEKYHITSIDQLKDPKLTKLFNTNANGKADLTGCTPGWGYEAVIKPSDQGLRPERDRRVQSGKLCGDHR